MSLSFSGRSGAVERTLLTQAAKRLGEIYDQGIAGVSRNNAESLKWYSAARVLGEDVPVAKNRSYTGRYERPDAGLPER